jgi:hypothetical protein
MLYFSRHQYESERIFCSLPSRHAKNKYSVLNEKEENFMFLFFFSCYYELT